MFDMDKNNENAENEILTEKTEDCCSESGEVSEKSRFEKKSDKKCGRKEKLAEKALEEKDKMIADLKGKLEESEDKYLRMLAEYDNFRKRVQKEKESIYVDTKAECVEMLLSVLDNLERASAVDVSKSDAQSVVDGVNNILRQAGETFAKMGVEEIAAKGEKFNPELHNAVMHDESEDFEENTISDVFLKGYKIGDKVIRHSMVKVMN